ncbi:hypothetical protein GGH99_001637 [Coemansia sp. RSA 1285]|nr:hypothetical protein GGH99_001637 [Coemansia sp. RSA 1285]
MGIDMDAKLGSVVLDIGCIQAVGTNEKSCVVSADRMVAIYQKRCALAPNSDFSTRPEQPDGAQGSFLANEE